MFNVIIFALNIAILYFVIRYRIHIHVSYQSPAKSQKRVSTKPKISIPAERKPRVYADTHFRRGRGETPATMRCVCAEGTGIASDNCKWCHGEGRVASQVMDLMLDEIDAPTGRAA